MPAPNTITHPSGRWLRDHRQSHDLTQAELAMRVGMSQASISRVENGVDPLTERLAMRLIQFAEADAGEAMDLLYPDGAPPPYLTERTIMAGLAA